MGASVEDFGQLHALWRNKRRNKVMRRLTPVTGLLQTGLHAVMKYAKCNICFIFSFFFFPLKLNLLNDIF